MGINYFKLIKIGFCSKKQLTSCLEEFTRKLYSKKHLFSKVILTEKHLDKKEYSADDIKKIYEDILNERIITEKKAKMLQIMLNKHPLKYSRGNSNGISQSTVYVDSLFNRERSRTAISRLKNNSLIFSIPLRYQRKEATEVVIVELTRIINDKKYNKNNDKKIDNIYLMIEGEEFKIGPIPKEVFKEVIKTIEIFDKFNISYLYDHEEKNPNTSLIEIKSNIKEQKENRGREFKQKIEKAGKNQDLRQKSERKKSEKSNFEI